MHLYASCARHQADTLEAGLTEAKNVRICCVFCPQSGFDSARETRRTRRGRHCHATRLIRASTCVVVHKTHFAQYPLSTTGSLLYTLLLTTPIKPAMAEKGDTTTSTSVGDLTSSGKEVPKAVIKNVDMSEEMQQEAVDIATAALEKYNIEKDIAAQIKKEFDRRFNPTWHVVVGKNFGSYVTHGTHSLLIPDLRSLSGLYCASFGANTSRVPSIVLDHLRTVTYAINDESNSAGANSNNYAPLPHKATSQTMFCSFHKTHNKR